MNQGSPLASLLERIGIAFRNLPLLPCVGDPAGMRLVLVPVSKEDAAACNAASERFSTLLPMAASTIAAFEAEADPLRRVAAWEVARRVLEELEAATNAMMLAIGVVLSQLDEHDVTSVEIRKLRSWTESSFAQLRQRFDDRARVFQDFAGMKGSA